MSEPASDIVVTLSSNNPAITVPPTITVLQGATTATFNATAQTTATGWIVVSAIYNGVNKGVVFTISTSSLTAPKTSVREISCAPKSLTSGSKGLCRVTLDNVDDSTAADLQLSSSSDSIKLPDSIRTRPGQSTVDFQVDAAGSTAADGIVVAAQLGDDVVRDTLAVAPDRSKAIRVPGRQFARYGSEIRFQVSTADPAAALAADSLPPGAAFDSAAGEFRWTPDASQLGAHEIAFSAIDSAGAKAAASVTVEVESGEPIATAILNAASRSSEAACSPGAIASIQGRWFMDAAPASDLSGQSNELSGIRVSANGIFVPLLSASATELAILCPDSVAGSRLEFVVQTDHGIAAPVRTVARAAAPGIFSVNGVGDGQGSVLLDGSAQLAVVRNYSLPGQPAWPGDRVVVYATGIDRLANVSAHIGDAEVAPAAVTSVPGRPGLFSVTLSIPKNVAAANDAKLGLTGDTPDGVRVSTNLVSIALERNDR
jgi:uncharacterized protein (TIGR03437 family)